MSSRPPTSTHTEGPLRLLSGPSVCLAVLLRPLGRLQVGRLEQLVQLLEAARHRVDIALEEVELLLQRSVLLHGLVALRGECGPAGLDRVDCDHRENFSKLVPCPAASSVWIAPMLVMAPRYSATPVPVPTKASVSRI